MIRDYIIKERLGIGSYGTVYKVKKKNTNKYYVIKQISLLGLCEQQINEYKSEASLLSSIKSDYVVKYYDSFVEKNYLNIIMEYCDGGDLSQFIEEKKKSKHFLPEMQIWELFIKMILGLSSIHKKKILHRDLKTQNIFLTKSLEVKIGDLGVAKKLNHTNFAKTFIGTPYYLSPEICSEKPYNDKSDIWAIGCILYELCTYKHPFNAKSQGALILKILNNTPENINQYYSRDLQKMIDILLNKNYLQRPSCSDILKMTIVLLKAKKCKLFEEVFNESSKYTLYIDLDNSTYLENKERKSYDGGKISKNLSNLNKNLYNEDKYIDNKINLEKNKNNKNIEYHNLLDGLNSNNNKNERQINNINNKSFIKYNSKYNNHYYYNSNNKKENKINIKKEIINSTKNKNIKSKLIKNVITKLINKKNNNKQNNQINKNQKENHFMELLNNALNEVNNKIINIKNKEKSFIKYNKKTHLEKPKTPSIKNIKKNEISLFANNYKINNFIKEKNEIKGYSNKPINQSQYSFYKKKQCNTEEKIISEKLIDGNNNRNILFNKDHNKSTDIEINKINDNQKMQCNSIFNTDNFKNVNIENNIKIIDNTIDVENIKSRNIMNVENIKKSGNIMNVENIKKNENIREEENIRKFENLKDVEINKKNDNSPNINNNKQNKVLDIKEFANNLNNYVNKYRNSEFNTLNQDYENNKKNLINNINNNNKQKMINKKFSTYRSSSFENKNLIINNKDNSTITEEESNTNNMNDTNTNNKVFEISINKVENKFTNNNNYINNNINININNINSSSSSSGNFNNSNNNNIINTIMDFKIINNNDSDIHININNSTLNSMNSNKTNIITLDSNNTNSNIIMNNKIINNAVYDNDNDKGLYSEEENSEEQNEFVQEIKENNVNIENLNNNYLINDNINLYGNINIDEYKNKLIKEKNYLKEKINIIKDNMLALIGASDYNYIINIYNNTDNENENVDEIYEKIENFVKMHYEGSKKENFDNLYLLLISLDSQLVEKDNKLKSFNIS